MATVSTISRQSDREALGLLSLERLDCENMLAVLMESQEVTRSHGRCGESHSQGHSQFGNSARLPIMRGAAQGYLRRAYAGSIAALEQTYRENGS